MKKIMVDEAFLKTIETDYAVQYLTKLRIEPTNANVRAILKKYPLSNCEIKTSGWDNVK